MIEFTICPTSLIDYVWSDIEGYIKGATDRSNGESTSDNVKALVKSGANQLLLVTNDAAILAAITLEVRTFNSGLRVLNIPMVGGTNIKLWIGGFMKAARHIAVQNGATEIRGYMARKGWSRFLKTQDKWAPVHEVMSCQVGEL